MIVEPGGTSEQHRRAKNACEHDYQLDQEMEMWVCAKCGTALDLVTQQSHHECGADCDRHGDISAIG